MARFLCDCGCVISNSTNPEEIQKYVFTQFLWKEWMNKGFYKVEPEIVWKCPYCLRIHRFNEKGLRMSTYRLLFNNNERSIRFSVEDFRCGICRKKFDITKEKKLRLYIYDDARWDLLTEREWIFRESLDMKKLPAPTWMGIFCLNCSGIHIFNIEFTEYIYQYVLEESSARDPEWGKKMWESFVGMKMENGVFEIRMEDVKKWEVMEAASRKK
jgi:hypothetical protein